MQTKFSTRRRESWHRGGLFKNYAELHKVDAVSGDIAGMDALSLNHWLSKFMMGVVKKSG